jgi:colanic acid biosynthesis glycosyl transferase WcaI
MVFDYQLYRELGDLYAAADIGLIAIEPGVEMVNMPSKTYSILAAGKPFIAVAGGSRDLQALAADGAGVVVDNDAAAVAAAMARLCAHPRVRYAMGRTARRIFDERYTRERVTRLYARLLGAAGVADIDATTNDTPAVDTQAARPAA